MSYSRQNCVPILYFTNSTLWGGVEEHICGLLRNLSCDLFRTSLVCDPAIFGRFREAIPADVEVMPLELSSPAHFLSAARFASLVLRERFQIVHSHMFWSSLFASPIAWASSVPVIIETLHGTEAWRKGWKASNKVDRTVNHFVSKHIAVCESDARFLAVNKHVPAGKIAIIHNGIDPLRFAVAHNTRQAIRHTIAAADTDCVLITTARFHKGKGHRVLLDAMRRVVVKHPHAKLVLLGEGEEQAEMKALCKSLRISDRVRFAGYQTNVAEWLGAADINVLPTFYEGFPLTILEAMAAGLPTVASNVGGIPEAIQDGVSGLLVRAGDAQKLAEAISSLISDSDARQRIGSAARTRVCQRFTFDLQIRATEELYLELLGDMRMKGRNRIAGAFTPSKQLPFSADTH